MLSAANDSQCVARKEQGVDTATNETWAVRATAWELAAFSFRHPTRELAEAVACGEWLAAACEVVEALGAELPEGFGDGVPSEESPLAEADVDAFFHRLRAEATRLFVGPGEPVCSPYEGVWRAKADGVKPLLFVNPHSMEVERFVKSCGFAQPEGKNDPLDHVATECELLEALALRAASGEGSMGDGPNFCGGSAAAVYSRFLSEHLSMWLPDFCDACEARSGEPFCRAAAAYLRALAGSSQGSAD